MLSTKPLTMRVAGVLVVLLGFANNVSTEANSDPSGQRPECNCAQIVGDCTASASVEDQRVVNDYRGGPELRWSVRVSSGSIDLCRLVTVGIQGPPGSTADFTIGPVNIYKRILVRGQSITIPDSQRIRSVDERVTVAPGYPRCGVCEVRGAATPPAQPVSPSSPAAAVSKPDGQITAGGAGAAGSTATPPVVMPGTSSTAAASASGAGVSAPLGEYDPRSPSVSIGISEDRSRSPYRIVRDGVCVPSAVPGRLVCYERLNKPQSPADEPSVQDTGEDESSSRQNGSGTDEGAHRGAGSGPYNNASPYGKSPFESGSPFDRSSRPNTGGFPDRGDGAGSTAKDTSGRDQMCERAQAEIQRTVVGCNTTLPRLESAGVCESLKSLIACTNRAASVPGAAACPDLAPSVNEFRRISAQARAQLPSVCATGR